MFDEETVKPAEEATTEATPESTEPVAQETPEAAK